MKYIITTTLIILSLGLKAQTSPQAKPIKKDSAKYQKVVTMPISDYNLIYGALQDYKRLSMYEPANNDTQKVTVYKNIEAYLKDLPARVKLDSVKVKAN